MNVDAQEMSEEYRKALYKDPQPEPAHKSAHEEWCAWRKNPSDMCDCPEAQPQPDRRRYCPDPRTQYGCVYCNEPVHLLDADAVVDSYQNVIHLKCYDKEVAPNVRH